MQALCVRHWKYGQLPLSLHKGDRFISEKYYFQLSEKYLQNITLKFLYNIVFLYEETFGI